MYRVIEFFTDLQDGEHIYRVGDAFPRKGLNVSLARIIQLSSANNLRGKPLIEEVKDLKEEKVIAEKPEMSEKNEPAPEKKETSKPKRANTKKSK